MITNTDTKLRKTIVITGATSGIGLETAIQFVNLGWFVIGVGRSLVRIQQAVKKIVNLNPDGQFLFLQADLAEQEEVQKLSKMVKISLNQHGYQYLDVLINNAGGFHEYKQMTSDGIEKTFAVNHLSGFILTISVYPMLVKSNRGRVITLSSYAHRMTPLNLKRITNPWPHVGLLAYKRSKLCNILFTNEFNRKQSRVQAFAVDPGLVNTQIASKGKPGISNWVWQLHRHQGTTTNIPVRTLIYLATENKINTSEGFYFRDSQPQRPSKNAMRIEYAQKLWDLSVQLTGLDLVDTRK